MGMSASVVALGDPAVANGVTPPADANPNVSFAANAMSALQGADALAIATEWKTFRAPDFAAMKAALKAPIVFDGRNLYEPETMAEHGFDYYPIGRRQAK